jgi:hypothetical protein
MSKALRVKDPAGGGPDAAMEGVNPYPIHPPHERLLHWGFVAGQRQIQGVMF